MEEHVKGLMDELQAPLKVESGQNAPHLREYAQRLDEIFGYSWKMETKLEGGNLVYCQISVAQPGIGEVKRSAIDSGFDKAFMKACRLLGIGRHPQRN